MNTSNSISKKVTAGAAWMVAARWSMRGIGLVSTIILARLLTPADFGIVAISMIVVGLVGVFSQTGLVQSLIRHPNPTDDHFNTVFTLQVMTGVLIAAILFFIAPLGAIYFDDPRVENVVQVLALRALIQGFENPGIIWFRKNMQFDKDFQFLVMRKFVRFFVVVILAFSLRTYWALVYALVSSSIIAVAISYLMHPFRPKFSLARIGDVWSYSLWMLVVHIGLFINNRIDEIIIGGTTNTTNVGFYNVSTDLARSPTQEITVPVMRVLFSAYATLVQMGKNYSKPFLKSFSSIAVVCFATGGGISLITEDLVLVVLGNQWVPSIGPMFWIALSAIVFALSSAMSQLLSVLGHVKTASVLSWIRVVGLIPALYWAATTGDLTDVAMSRFFVLLGLLIPTIPIFSYMTKISSLSILGCLWKPAIALGAMALVVLPVDFVIIEPSALRLIIKVSLGALCYSSVTYGLWQLTNRPDGLEETVDKALRGSWQRLSKAVVFSRRD
jgi:O-antigen/teichoic acid export membrane protein